MLRIFATEQTRNKAVSVCLVQNGDLPAAEGIAHKKTPSLEHARQRRAGCAIWNLHSELVPEGWDEWSGLFSGEAVFKRRPWCPVLNDGEGWI